MPEVRFVDSGSGRIAYQVFGGGDFDLLHVTHLSAIDMVWEHPAHLRMWRTLGAMARVIRFDPRGQGASDPMPIGEFGVDSYVEDMVAVLDAVASDSVSVIGEALGGSAALALAAHYPGRVRNIVLLNALACGQAREGYPWALTPEVMPAVRAIAEMWGTGQAIASAVPRLAGANLEFLDFCARYERAIAGPTEAGDLFRAVYDVDIRSILPSVDVPVLVEYTGDVAAIGAEHSHYLVDQLGDAQLLELYNTSFYSGDPNMTELDRFLTGGVFEAGDQELLTVVFTDCVRSTDRLAEVGDTWWSRTLDDLDEFVVRSSDRHDGTIVKSTGDGHLLTFRSPQRAVEAATAIRRGAHALELELRTGIHIGLVQLRVDGDIAGMTVNIAARIAAMADGDQVLVSRTVADVLVGTGVDLRSVGDHQLKGVPGSWEIFALQ